MVREQPDRMESQVAQNLGADPVLVLQLPLAGLALVVHEVPPVRHDAGLGQRVALDPEPRSGLMEVNQDAPALLRDRPQRVAQEAAAFARPGAENVAVNAAGM